MFSIYLLLIALVAIAIVTEQKLFSTKQAEFIPISVRVTKSENLGSQHFDHNGR